MKKLFLSIILLLIINPLAAKDSIKVIHVFVALCDNKSQGIVPVPKKIGNGNAPFNNLYWGAGAGVKTFFKKSPNWTLISSKKVNDKILERIVFKHKRKNAYLVAYAYRGYEINDCIKDFLKALAGDLKKAVTLKDKKIKIGDSADLIVYVGHDGLMDFWKPTIATWRLSDNYPERKNNMSKQAVLLCCKASTYFKIPLKKAKAYPLIWTTGLMCPEAYTLEAIAEGWLLKESNKQIHLRASKAYHKYQKCGLSGAKRLFKTGW